MSQNFAICAIAISRTDPLSSFRVASGCSTVFIQSFLSHSVLAQLINGEKLDAHFSDKLMALVKKGELLFHAVMSGKLQPPKSGVSDAPRAGSFSSPDALLTPSYMAEAAADPGIGIEPAWKVSIVYGMPCAMYRPLPDQFLRAADRESS